MRLGIDVSTMKEVRSAGARYFARGVAVDPISYIHDELGVTTMRLRLWLNPYDEDGQPYQGGTVDYPTFLELAKEGVAKGYRIVLDFHYSDFWTDPSKQTMPKAWRGLSLEEVASNVYEYTKETLRKTIAAGVPLHGVQIGNEITNGMLWPLGRLEAVEGESVRRGYPNLFLLLSKASKAVREVDESIRIVVHLERSFDAQIYREFFDEMTYRGLDFDVIGMSYYPYWHGTFDQLFANVDALKKRFGKAIWIVETAYAFTMDAVDVNGESWSPWVEKTEINGLHYEPPFPFTQEGQAGFLRELIRLSEEHGVEEIHYWEPLWLPLPGLNWTSLKGQDYINQHEKPPHNEWMNQCLFDYQGHATKGLYAFCAKHK